jgi:ribosomal protein S12 methylthiotransferase
VFGYSDEDGTAAADLPGHLDEDEIAARVDQVSRLAEELVSQRAEDRVGERVAVLLESVDATTDGPHTGVGRTEGQGPEVDGSTTVSGLPDHARVGDIVAAAVVGSDGVDLHAVADPSAG